MNYNLNNQETKEFLLTFVPAATELDASLTPSRGKASSTPLFPEVDFYISLLVLISLIDNNKGNLFIISLFRIICNYQEKRH